MSDIASPAYLDIDNFAAGWGAQELGALVDFAHGLYVQRARDQTWARRSVALLALAEAERQALARRSKRIRGTRWFATIVPKHLRGAWGPGLWPGAPRAWARGSDPGPRAQAPDPAGTRFKAELLLRNLI